MKEITEKERNTKVIAVPQVLVVGAGPAGIAAAIAAAEAGADTLLVEKYGYVGGNMTIAMVNPIFTFHDVNGRQVISGIAERLVSRMKQKGYSMGHVTDLTFDNASMTPFDPEGCKVTLFEMLEEAGVRLLLHAMVVDIQEEDFKTDMGDRYKVTAVIIESVSGRQAILPDYVIDCSGNAEIVSRKKYGYVFDLGDGAGNMQPATLYFRIGGVDNKALRQWMKENRNLLKDNPTDEEIDSQKAIAFIGMNDLLAEAVKKGEIDKEVAPRILMYELPHGQFSVNTTRLQNVDGTDIRSLTNAEIRLRKQVIEVFAFLKKHVGGFSSAYIIDTGAQVGIRETRHIIGDYTLDEDDILSGRSFEDGIACGTFAIDIHPSSGKQQIFTGSGKHVYEIPYRSLLPVNAYNVLVAGRCISANHIAYGSIRVMATCMAMGQAAGTAAAILSKRGCDTREIDTTILRQTLIRNGQYLLNADCEEKIDKGLVLNREHIEDKNSGHYNPFKDIQKTEE